MVQAQEALSIEVDPRVLEAVCDTLAGKQVAFERGIGAIVLISPTKEVILTLAACFTDMWREFACQGNKTASAAMHRLVTRSWALLSSPVGGSVA